MITVYTRDEPFCSYCQNAKRLLNSKAIPFEERKIGQDISRETLMEQFTEAKTLPVITVGGVYIGGYNELVRFLSESNGEAELLVE